MPAISFTAGFLTLNIAFAQNLSAQDVIVAPAQSSASQLGVKPSLEPNKLTVRSPPQLVLDTEGFNSQILALALSADGRYVFASTDSDIRIWNVDTGKLEHTIHCFQRGQSGTIMSLAVDPKNETLAIGVKTNHGSYLKSCRLDALNSSAGLWGNVNDVNQLGQGVTLGLRSARALTFSGDGRFLSLIATGTVVKNGKPAEQISYVKFDWPKRQLLEAHVAPEVEQEEELEEFFGTPWLPQSGQYYGSKRYYVLPYYHSAYDDVANVDVDLNAAPDLQWYDRFTRRYLANHQNDPSFRLFGYRGRITDRVMAMAYLSKKNGRDVFGCEIYSGENDQPTARYDGLRWAPSDITMSHDAKRVALGDGTGTVHVIACATGKRIFQSRSKSRSTYAASLDQASGVLAFGQRPNQGKQWKFNDYAKLAEGFNLKKRRFVKQPAGNFPRPQRSANGLQGLPSSNDAGKFVTVTDSNGRQLQTKSINQPLFSFTLTPGKKPQEVLLFQGYSGLCKVDVLNTDNGRGTSVSTVAVASAGNASAASDVNLSADGELVTVSWTDGTVCIYRKRDFGLRQIGKVPFDIRVPASLESLEAGLTINRMLSQENAGDLQVGDRVVTINGQMTSLFLVSYLHQLAGNNAGDSLEVQYLRGTQQRRTTIKLIPSPLKGRSNVEPVLTFFKTRNDDWILFAPSGHYDASPGGHNLLGWKVNRSPDQTAEYFTAHQMRKTMYRPELIEKIIDSILTTPQQATANATRENNDPTGEIAAEVVVDTDLREEDSFQSVLPPAVSIVGLPANGVVSTPKVKLTVTASSQNNVPVKSIFVQLNGRPAVTGPAPLVRHPDGTVTVEQVIDVPVGKLNVSVIATNRSASSTPKTITLRRAGKTTTAPQRPRMLVLAVGVSDYLNDDYDLEFPATDAIDFSKAMTSQEGKFYHKVETKVLTDKQATRGEIQDAMDWLYDTVKPDDIAVLFIAGHGVFDPRNNFYFANYETDVNRLRSTALAYTEIENAIKDMPCKVLLFADTCHAGAARGFGGIRDPWTDLVSGEIGAVLFASSTPREESQESREWGHGAFTYALLESLKERKTDVTGDGFISLTELELSVSEKVQTLTDDQQHPTTQKPGTIPNFNIATSGSD